MTDEQSQHVALLRDDTRTETVTYAVWVPEGDGRAIGTLTLNKDELPHTWAAVAADGRDLGSFPMVLVAVRALVAAS